VREIDESPDRSGLFYGATWSASLSFCELSAVMRAQEAGEKVMLAVVL
jgi:hypothetical protein